MPPCPSRTRELRAIIRSHKRWDVIFGVLGLLAMMVGILTLAALFIDMAIDGVPRLTGDFFTSFPSRRAGAGRHPVGLGRLDAGDAGHRAGRRPGRHRRRDLPRGVRAQELVHRHHRDQHHQPRGRAVDRLRPAGARPVRLHLRPRAEHPVGRPDAGAADPADRDRRRRARRCARYRSTCARAPMRAARRSGRSSATTSCPTACPAS